MGNLFTTPLSLSESKSSHSGTPLLATDSTDSLILFLSLLFSFISITSLIEIKKEGISTFLPFTNICPWFTYWRASFLELRNPKRYTTLSSLLSRLEIKLFPVTPGCLFDLTKLILNCFSVSPYILFNFCFSLNPVSYTHLTLPTTPYV